MLRLERPFVIFDLETTGINVEVDRVVDIGLLKIYPDGTEKEWDTLVNPGIPISQEAMEAHHITDEMVKDSPTFASIAPIIAAGFKDVDLGGFNHRTFDNLVLMNELKRCGHTWDPSMVQHVDVYRLYTKLRPRSLSALIKELFDEEFEEAHRALPDVRATWRGLKGLLQKFPELPRTVAGLHDYCFGDSGDSLAGGKFYFRNGHAVMNFGKHKHLELHKCPKDYLRWIISVDFPSEVKDICREALQERYPVRKSR